MTTNHDRPKVYRLQGLPDRPNFDRLAAAQLVASVIHDPTLAANDIHICSLATAVEPHRKWTSKVATVMFEHTPTTLTAADGARQWEFNVPGFTEPLVLDSHFLGLTVLNDVSITEHRFDCIALSGLASHPFGSWQPKGDDKSYMWIRDTLPNHIDGVRFILFGYDTTLKDSDSFQTIVDIANTLYLTLQINGWASPSTKPLVFIAHSLGGVLLKQLLVMLAGANSGTQFMLSMIKGAIFFGTPSRGMAMGQLLTMVGDQPNKELVEYLSETSEFLPNLETRFAGISHIQRMRLYWAYETKTSQTVQLSNGMYKRSGPRSIMVDHQSATGSRGLDPSFSIQIDEDHSGMVKFNRDDHRIPTIINKIQEMCSSAGTTDGLDSNVSGMSVDSDKEYDSGPNYSKQDLSKDAADPGLVGWDYNLIISLLKTPVRDQRYEQIDQNYGRTFSWAFENHLLGLSQWLREGHGIFWINGKPGSGKSTIMKFILNDYRTKELLHHWRSKSTQITAHFFFHHRGTYLQKSFEGLLGSLLSQLLEGDHRLHRIVGEFLDEKASDLYDTVPTDVNSFFQHCKIDRDDNSHRKRMVSLLTENPSLRLHDIIQECAQNMTLQYITPLDRLLIQETLLRDFDSLSYATKSQPEYARAERSACRKLKGNFDDQFATWEQTIKIIIRKWCESLDTSSRIRNVLGKVQLAVSQQKFEQSIDKIAGLQRDRQKRLIGIQFMKWTQSDLEEGLRRVFDQKLFDLDVCLFFDALDEYVGRSEVISAFLKDLVKVTPTSRTRTKILFSSRPWTVFLDQFGTCPSFSMHEHTMEDIHEYCAGSLPACGRTRSMIRPFVGEIADRARGVFVWVKLVMEDLSTLAATTDESDEKLSQMLRQCLETLPDELEDYYSAIIDRVPASTRRQSYILLECLSKSTMEIDLHDFPSLLACGMSDSISKAREIIANRSVPAFTDPEGHVRTLSGGLVEIVHNPHFLKNIYPRDAFMLQFMHQTVKDWVEMFTFKHTILGTRADMTWENGHSFLVKYHVHRAVSAALGTSRSMIFDHAAKAEMTTGVSQYTYFSKLPHDDAYTITIADMPSPEFTRTFAAFASINSPLPTPQFLGENHQEVLEPAPKSLLSLAALNGLSLYLADSVQRDKSVFERATEPLVFNLLDSVRYQSVVQQSALVSARLQSVKLILDNGFRIHRHPNDLSLIFEGIWRSPDQETAAMYTDLVFAAARNGMPLTVLFDTDLDPCSPTSLLHLSPPRLARYLLKEGADPNLLNSANQSPLDYIVGSRSVFQSCPSGFDWLYDTVELLLKNGAQRRRGTGHSQHSQHQELLRRLGDNGYDTRSLLSLLNQSLVVDEQGVSPLDPGNDMADVLSPEAYAKRPMVPNVFSRMFHGRGVSSKRQTRVPR